MGSRAAVGVHNNFSAGQAAVTLRTTHHKAACGVHEKLHVAFDQVFRQHRLDDLLNHCLAKFFKGDVRGMLGGEHHRVDSLGPAIDIAKGDLGFRIGPKPWEPAISAQERLALDKTVGEVDGRGH